MSSDHGRDVLVRPFVVAHRAGNDLLRLRDAEASGATLIEADVHLFRDRLEVRHLKTAGPVPILWDRWTVASPRAPRLELDDLLRAAAPSTTLMLDLKGRDPRVGERVAAALRDRAGETTVCARAWPLVEPLRHVQGVRLVRSIGGRRGLARLLAEPARGRLDGVSIHRRLLTPQVVAALKRRADLLMTWPVAAAEEAVALAGWGVDGMITENYAALVPALERGR